VTRLSWRGTGVAGLDLAGRAAAVPGRGVGVVAFLRTHQQAVAALGLTAKAGPETDPTHLHGRAIGRAAVAARGVAVIADLVA